MTEKVINITFKDFKLLEDAVAKLKPNSSIEESIRIIQEVPEIGTYRLYLEVDYTIKDLIGIYRTEIWGDYD